MKFIPVWLRFFLAAMGIELVRSFLPPLAYLLDGISAWLSYPIHILSDTVGLALLFATVGVAFAASRTSVPRAIGAMGMTVAAFTFGGLSSLLWQALFLRLAVTTEELAALLGSAVDSAVVPMAVAFLLGYFLFIAKDRKSAPKSFTELSSMPTRAAAVAAGAICLYQLLGQTVYTWNFINDYGFLRTGEILTIIVDFLLIFVTSTAGYFTILYTRRLYLAALRRQSDLLKEGKKENG